MEHLKKFLSHYKSKRDFVQTVEANEIFDQLQSEYVNEAWLSTATTDHKLVVLEVLRVLLRDHVFLQTLSRSTNAIVSLSQELKCTTPQYFLTIDQEKADTLCKTISELANIFQKITNQEASHSLLLNKNVDRYLFQLTSSHDLMIHQASLCAIVNICKSREGREAVLTLYPLDTIINFIASYDASSQSLASDLFLLLSQEPEIQQQMKECDQLPTCISVLQSGRASQSVKQQVTAALERVLIDDELVESFRSLAGIPIVLSLMKAGAGEVTEMSLTQSCLSLLTRLSLHDTCAKQIVECNGIYTISCQIVLSPTQNDAAATSKLQTHGLRALRYLFSLESNRRYFKRLFPLQIFETFINIGHYVYQLQSYSHLTELISSQGDEDHKLLLANIDSLNQHNKMLCTIGEYSVLELLGTGAFGSVYRVTPHGSASSGAMYAMKEIKAHHPAVNASKMSNRADSVGQLKSEVAMIKENFRHPNIVKYYKCFQEGQNIYIVMSLAEGAPLSEHIASQKEKKKLFAESRIWNIFSQLILALRYLHEDKSIVHRDIKPPNMILGERDKLVITDFGLAARQQELSVMKSTVGTVIYWCPELVQNEQYNKKADIWASGCVLYQMAALEPPFYSTNLLSLAKKIAEGTYDSKPLMQYSSQVQEVIRKCLIIEPENRPTATEIGGMIASHIMRQLDAVAAQCDGLEKKLSNERKQSIKQMEELVTTEHKYQQLASSSRPGSGTARRRLQPVLDGELNHLVNPLTPDGLVRESATSTTTINAPVAANPLQCSSLSNLRSGDIDGRSRTNSLSPIASARRRSAGSSLSISPRHLREIPDPVDILLQQLYKLVYISQLPPMYPASACDSLIAQYKRMLFAQNFEGAKLKSEMNKLCNRSNEAVSLLKMSRQLSSRAMDELVTSSHGGHGSSATIDEDGCITYEQLHFIIEEVLKRTDQSR